MDENSASDSRWHTGHLLQQENYSHILQQLLKTPWLGVIFKPKKSNTLHSRLGEVDILLKEALKTGRCVLLGESGKNVSNVPAILAGLVADVCVHGHLCAGTAAIECSLLGKPTILIDREGSPYSLLHELEENEVVFNNWPDAIDAIIEYFKFEQVNKKFGDWSDIIEQLDPFNDNKAGERISSYLEMLLNGLKQGVDRDKLLLDVASKYADLWGSDKVIENNKSI